MTVEKKLTIVLTAILILSAVGFLYTFIQSRYTATIVSVGEARTVTRSTRHGRKRYKVVPLIVTFTDENETEQTVEATYRWTFEAPTVGQQIVIVKSFNGSIQYPFTGLRTFCGALGFTVLVFLSFMCLDGARK